MGLREHLPFRLLAPAATLLTLGIVAAAWGGSLVIFGGREGAPELGGLARLSGTIATVRVLDSMSGAPIGTAAPGMTSIYVTLEGIAGTFIYPSGFPRYFEVQRELLGGATLWVDQADLETGEPRTIWQVERTAPPGFAVGRDEIAATLARSRAGNLRAGNVLMLAGGILVLGGWLGQRWNARQPPAPVAVRERFDHGYDQVMTRILDAFSMLERGYAWGERWVGALLGATLGRAIWSMVWVLAYGIGTIALGAWLM